MFLFDMFPVTTIWSNREATSYCSSLDMVFLALSTYYQFLQMDQLIKGTSLSERTFLALANSHPSPLSCPCLHTSTLFHHSSLLPVREPPHSRTGAFFCSQCRFHFRLCSKSSLAVPIVTKNLVSQDAAVYATSRPSCQDLPQEEEASALPIGELVLLPANNPMDKIRYRSVKQSPNHPQSNYQEGLSQLSVKRLNAHLILIADYLQVTPAKRQLRKSIFFVNSLDLSKKLMVKLQSNPIFPQTM